MVWMRRGWLCSMVVAALGAPCVACHRDSASGEPSPVSSSSSMAASAGPLIALADVLPRAEKVPGDPITHPGEASIETKLMPGAELARTPAVNVQVQLDPRDSLPADDATRITRGLDGLALGIATCVAAHAKPGWTPASTSLSLTARDDGSGARATVGPSPRLTWAAGGAGDCVLAGLQGALGGDARATELAFQVRVQTR